MVRATTSVRVMFFFLLGACGASCQQSASTDRPAGLQADVSISPEVQRQQTIAWKSLPDAPTPVEQPSQAERLHAFVIDARLPITFGEGGISTNVLQPGVTTRPRSMFNEKTYSTSWGKYLYMPMPKQELRHYDPASDSLTGRAVYAASSVLIARDDLGRGRLNTSYFLGVLTSAAIHSSYRPYRTGSTSATFNDFGSTIGGEMGINVYHAFEPDLRQMVKGFTPKFVSRLEGRITRSVSPKGFNATPGR